MRRVYLRRRENVLKRALIHVGALNLSLVMRQQLGKGTPRGLQDLSADSLLRWLRLWIAVLMRIAGEDALEPTFMLPAPELSFHRGIVNNSLLPRAARQRPEAKDGGRAFFCYSHLEGGRLWSVGICDHHSRRRYLECPPRQQSSEQPGSTLVSCSDVASAVADVELPRRVGWPRSTSEARRRYLRASRRSGRTYVWALVAGVLSVVALAGYWIVLFQLVKMPPNALSDVSNYPRMTVALMILMGSLVAPLMEEAGFRGYFQVALEHEFRGPVAGAKASGVLSCGPGLWRDSVSHQLDASGHSASHDRRPDVFHFGLAARCRSTAGLG